MFILYMLNANGGCSAEPGATGLYSCSGTMTDFQHDFDQIILFIRISDLATEHPEC